MAFKDATQVRLTPELDSRLTAVAARSGLRKSDLIRRAIEEFLDRVESDGQIMINLQSPPGDGGRRRRR